MIDSRFDGKKAAWLRPAGVVATMAVATMLLPTSGVAAPAKGGEGATAAQNAEAAQMRRYLEASRSEHNAKIKWKPITTMSFDDKSALDKLRVLAGQWEVASGQLWASGGTFDDNRTIMIAPNPAGPVRIEFDATLFPRPDGRICDICIRLNADPETGSFAKGYAFIGAQYFNQAAVCYKLNIPIARTEFTPIVPGKRHRIVVEWTDKHLRFFVDDKVLVEAWDRDKPLPPDPTRWIALSSYDTRMAVDNLVISVPEG